jgi:hypothetical protein
MLFKMMSAAFFSLVFGFVLGSIPGLNENLHWNLWYVVPISGLLFGCAMGGLQFWYCFKVNQRIKGGVIACLVIAALLGYGAVDYGIYRSITVTVEGHEEIPDGEYKFSELMTFWQYMKVNLGGTTVESSTGEKIEMGSTGATISYIADLIGAAVGGFCILLVCRDKYPFCEKCDRYKQREKKYAVKLVFDEQKIDEIFERMGKLIEAGVYTDLVVYCQQLASDHNDRKGDIKINIDQRYCSSCLEATMLGIVYRKSGGKWQELKDLKFSFTSQPGEHVTSG